MQLQRLESHTPLLSGIVDESLKEHSNNTSDKSISAATSAIQNTPTTSSCTPKPIASANSTLSEEILSLKTKVLNARLKCMQEIVRNSQNALEGSKEDKTWLEKGMWYPEDFLDACIKHNQQEKIDFIVNKEKFLYGYADPKYFKRLIELGGTKPERFCFRVKKGVSASEALNAIIRGFSISDCAMAHSVSCYSAILEIIGKEKFDKIFQGKFRMIIGRPVHQPVPIDLFLRYTSDKLIKDTKIGDRDVIEGESYYIEGVKDYYDKFPFSFLGAHNTVCVKATSGEQLFTSLGLNPEGESEEQIYTKFVDAFNKTPNPEKGLSKELKIKHHRLIERAKNLSNVQATVNDVLGFNKALKSFKLDLLAAIVATKPEDVVAGRYFNFFANE